MGVKPKKVFYPFTILQIPRVENWLRMQAQDGLRLIKYDKFLFIFTECKKRDRLYFIYKSPLTKKNDKFIGDYSQIRRLYGIRKSKLNQDKSSITEIDPHKMGTEFRIYSFARNTNYQKHCIEMLIAKIILLGLLLIATFYNTIAIPLLIATFFSTIWSIAYIIVLKKQYKKLKLQTTQE